MHTFMHYIFPHLSHMSATENELDTVSISWNLELQDPSLRSHLEQFNTSRQKYGVTELSFLIFFFALYNGVSFRTINYLWDQGDDDKGYRYQAIVLMILSITTLLPTIFGTWKNSTYCYKNSWIERLTISEANTIACFVLGFMVTSACLVVIQTANGQCEGIFDIAFPCNYYGSVGILPIITACTTVYSPLIIVNICPIISSRVIFIGWCCQLSSIISCICILRTYSALIFSTVLFVPVSLSYYTTYRDRMLMFLEHMKVTAIKESTHQQKLEAADKASRNMAAHTAHDLKIPLSSLTAGLDFLINTLEDHKEKADKHELDISALLKNLSFLLLIVHDLKNANLFMMNSVNRYQDYANLGQGLRLVPHLESFYLLETIKLPIKCMRDSQQKVRVRLVEIPSDITDTLIISDKQWLQENILCLLSNAVKYSSGGEVTIKVYKTERPKGLDETDGDDQQVNVNLSNNNFAVMSMNSFRSKVVSIMSSNDIQCRRVHAIPSTDSLLSNSKPKIKEFLRFEIEDNGVGIDEEAMQSIFSPFKATQNLKIGTGFGLYSLAKRIEALYGEYGVMPRRDGEPGSIFWFTIPFQPVEDDPVFALNHNTSIHRVQSASNKYDLIWKAGIQEMNTSKKYPINQMTMELRSSSKDIDGHPMSLHKITADIETGSEYSIDIGLPESTTIDESLPQSVSVPLPPGITIPVMQSSPSAQTSLRMPLQALVAMQSLSQSKMITAMLQKMNFHVVIAEDSERAIDLITQSVRSKLRPSASTTSIVVINNSRSPTAGRLVGLTNQQAQQFQPGYDLLIIDVLLDGFQTVKRIRDLEATVWNTSTQPNNSSKNYNREIDRKISSDSLSIAPLTANVKLNDDCHHMIIAVSDREDKDIQHEAIFFGCDAYLSNPISWSKLEQTVQRLLGNIHLRK